MGLEGSEEGDTVLTQHRSKSGELFLLEYRFGAGEELGSGRVRVRVIGSLELPVAGLDPLWMIPGERSPWGGVSEQDEGGTDVSCLPQEHRDTRSGTNYAS